MYTKKTRKRTRTNYAYRYDARHDQKSPQHIVVDVPKYIYNSPKHIHEQYILVDNPFSQNHCKKVVCEARVNRPPRPRVKRTRHPSKPSKQKRLTPKKF